MLCYLHGLFYLPGFHSLSGLHVRTRLVKHIPLESPPTWTVADCMLQCSKSVAVF